MGGADYELRLARLDDVEAIRGLIATSAHALSKGMYTPEQVDAALRGVFGVDTQLIQDQTYFLYVRGEDLAACGGWSYRETLFGSDHRKNRSSRVLDPASEAARIRAFFVHPNHARQGLGKKLLAHCEAEARQHGYQSAELGATLPGLLLYQACGYEVIEAIDYPMGDGLTLRILPMRKRL